MVNEMNDLRIRSATFSKSIYDMLPGVHYSDIKSLNCDKCDKLCYECCFDEENNEYNISKPHKHVIIRMHHVKAPGFMYNGIAIMTEVGWKFGCQKNI
jgi:hypothetical protein